MKNYSLDVPAPVSLSYVTRNIPEVSVEQRERALKATHYNEFAFPAGLLTVDMLSDSGTTSMTDVQWSAMFLGDESYGRNKGYYVLLDAFRDIFERGGEKKLEALDRPCPHRLPGHGQDDRRAVSGRIRGRIF